MRIFTNYSEMHRVQKKSFYIETLLLLIPIVVSIPLLIRMASHVLSYSHQTLLADGLALSDITVPDWFIPYFSGHEFTEYLRTCFYYAIRFLTPMALIWICLLLLCIYIRKNYVQNGYSFQAFLSPAFYGLGACLILLPVCYTYTLVIMDESWVCRLFSRSGHIFLWIFGIFLRNGQFAVPDVDDKRGDRYRHTGFFLSIPAVST